MVKERTKIAFVTPWYGRGIPGGAEAVAYQTSVRLAARGWAVEVLTTGIKDFYGDWGKNYHRPGVKVEEGVTVRRFPVEKRDRAAFDEINSCLMQNIPISAADEQTFIEQMIRAPQLTAYIQQHRDEYVFLFIPYMFTTTYAGAKIVPERTVLIPCIHDEAYARLPIYQEIIPQAHSLIMHSAAEKRLANALFTAAHEQPRRVVGVGVETNYGADGERFRQKYGLGESPFMLYVGRREAGKNVPLLIEYFQRYVQQENRQVKLVLIGPGEVHIPAGMQTQIIDCGFVSVQDKYDANAAATVICQPSIHESFSISLMEGWLGGAPALVHADCDVTREHCQASNGGLYFANYPEFAATLTYLLTHPQEAAIIGQQGLQYVQTHFAWEVVLDKYEQVIQQVCAL